MITSSVIAASSMTTSDDHHDDWVPKEEVGKVGKAWLCMRYGDASKPGVLSFVDRSFPSTLPEKHILIQVKAAALNPIDYKIVQGDFNSVIMRMSKPPFYAGKDYSGVVVQVWKDSKYKLGDEVFGDLSDTALHDGLIGGSFSSYMMIPDDRTALKPKSITHQQVQERVF